MSILESKSLSKNKFEGLTHVISSINKQIKAWRKANKKMGWGIKNEEFEKIQLPPSLSEEERNQGFIGVGLFYGFGDDGSGNADSVLSGKESWKYAQKSWWRKTWQCEYIDFDKPDRIRLRPEALPRPKGFYYAKFQPGIKFQSLTVSQYRKKSRKESGCGPEGIQFLTITNTHFQDMMNSKEIPFMALADYDVAPYGFHDFFDAMQMFYSNDTLGLGIGNVDFNYPLFGIPSIIFQNSNSVETSS